MVKIVFLRICTKEEILVFKISVHDLRTRTINMKAFVVFTRRLLLKLVQKTEITYPDLLPVPYRIDLFPHFLP